MKKIVLILSFLAASGACAWADDLALAADVSDGPYSILGGVVKSVSWADPVKGTRSEIVVTDSSRTNRHILVTSTTTLWDANAQAIMQDKITPRSRVDVIYTTTPEGINVGKSIKILK